MVQKLDKHMLISLTTYGLAGPMFGPGGPMLLPGGPIGLCPGG